MEFSEILGFFKILSESIKLLIKNGKFMAPITLLSLLLPSILLLLFSYFYQFLTNNMTNSIMNSSDADSGAGFFLVIVSYIVPLLAVEILALFLYIVIFQVSGIATILTSSMSYSDKKISLQDLVPRITTTWRRHRSNSFRTRHKNPTLGAAFFGVMIVTPPAIFYPNPITIAMAVVFGVWVFVINIYSAVVSALSYVVSIVEEVYEATEAVERGEELVRGQRQYGVMMNVLLNLGGLMVVGGGWMMLRDTGAVNVTAYGLLCVNLLSVEKILGATMYTVFYFQCKKFRGEDGGFEYRKLPAANVGSDIA